MSFVTRCLAGLMMLASAATTAITAQAETLKLAVTTSFESSGLAEIILPEIQRDTGIEVQLIVVGTGQALKLGSQGDVDAVLVHAKKAEEQFLADGFGTRRTEIMYNDFILVGPKADPAGIANTKDVVAALKSIEAAKADFVSRGDDSGTHKKELSLWTSAGFDAKSFDSGWYRAVGAGMGAALNTAAGLNAYIIADRASWLNFKNKADLVIASEGDPRLFNQYAYLTINKEKFPNVKSDLSDKLEAWLVSDKGQKMIGDYEIAGQQLFVANARKANAS